MVYDGGKQASQIAKEAMDAELARKDAQEKLKNALLAEQIKGNFELQKQKLINSGQLGDNVKDIYSTVGPNNLAFVLQGLQNGTISSLDIPDMNQASQDFNNEQDFTKAKALNKIKTAIAAQMQAQAAQQNANTNYGELQFKQQYKPDEIAIDKTKADAALEQAKSLSTYRVRTADTNDDKAETAALRSMFQNMESISKIDERLAKVTTMNERTKLLAEKQAYEQANQKVMQDLQQQKINNAYELGTRNTDIRETSVNNDYDINQNKILLGKSALEIDKMRADAAINQANSLKEFRNRTANANDAKVGIAQQKAEVDANRKMFQNMESISKIDERLAVVKDRTERTKLLVEKQLYEQDNQKILQDLQQQKINNNYKLGTRNADIKETTMNNNYDIDQNKILLGKEKLAQDKEKFESKLNNKNSNNDLKARTSAISNLVLSGMPLQDAINYVNNSENVQQSTQKSVETVTNDSKVINATNQKEASDIIINAIKSGGNVPDINLNGTLMRYNKSNGKVEKVK